MSGFPSDLRARVYRSRSANGSTAPDPTVGLRLRSDPFERHGRVWQWVVDIDPGLPTLTEVLASCHDFLVDDDCGREVGVVEGVDVDPDSAAPERLRVVQGWGRRRTTISIDEVIEVTPGERRLVIACRDGHDMPQAGPPRTTTWKPANVGGESGRWWRSWSAAEPSGGNADESATRSLGEGFHKTADASRVS